MQKALGAFSMTPASQQLTIACKVLPAPWNACCCLSSCFVQQMCQELCTLPASVASPGCHAGTLQPQRYHLPHCYQHPPWEERENPARAGSLSLDVMCAEDCGTDANGCACRSRRCMRDCSPFWAGRPARWRSCAPWRGSWERTTASRCTTTPQRTASSWTRA